MDSIFKNPYVIFGIIAGCIAHYLLIKALTSMLAPHEKRIVLYIILGAEGFASGYLLTFYSIGKISNLNITFIGILFSAFIAALVYSEKLFPIDEMPHSNVWLITQPLAAFLWCILLCAGFFITKMYLQ